MGLIACYRKNWAELWIAGEAIPKDEGYLCIRTPLDYDTPDDLRRSSGRTQAAAYVARNDRDLHVFELRWREHRVDATRVDRGIAGKELPLDDPDIHLDEAKVLFPGERE